MKGLLGLRARSPGRCRYGRDRGRVRARDARRDRVPPRRAPRLRTGDTRALAPHGHVRPGRRVTATRPRSTRSAASAHSMHVRERHAPPSRTTADDSRRHQLRRTRRKTIRRAAGTRMVRKGSPVRVRKRALSGAGISWSGLGSGGSARYETGTCSRRAMRICVPAQCQGGVSAGGVRRDR